MFNFIYASLLWSLGAQIALAGPVGQNFKKIVVVFFENEDRSRVEDEPFFRELMTRGTSFSNFVCAGHPSQPNYIAFISGSRNGVFDNEPHQIDARHLGDLLEDKKLSWKTYAEGYPGNCFLGIDAGKYVRRHVPFLSFKNIQENKERCARIVSGEQFKVDIERGDLPTFSLYIPDNNHNGHDTGVAYASKWADGFFRPLIVNPELTKDTLFVFTFDESRYFGFRKIYTVFVGAGAIPGKVVATRSKHYDILRTIEDEFDLGSLGKHDVTSRYLQEIFD
jgi:acid phosphatase